MTALLVLGRRATFVATWALLIAYSGTAIPNLIAGQVSRTFTLFEIALGYGALAGLACIITLAAARDPARVS